MSPSDQKFLEDIEGRISFVPHTSPDTYRLCKRLESEGWLQRTRTSRQMNDAATYIVTPSAYRYMEEERARLAQIEQDRLDRARQLVEEALF